MTSAQDFAKSAKEFAEQARLQKENDLNKIAKDFCDIVTTMLIEHKGRWSEDFSEVTLELRNKANMVDGAEKLSWAAKRLKTMGFSIVTHKFYTDDYYIDGLDFITLKVD